MRSMRHEDSGFALIADITNHAALKGGTEISSTDNLRKRRKYHGYSYNSFESGTRVSHFFMTAEEAVAYGIVD